MQQKRLMYKRIFASYLVSITLISCAVTHNKHDLIDYKTNHVSTNSLRLDGYFYREYPYKTDSSDRNFVYANAAEEIDHLDIILIYDDGFSIYLPGINGVEAYYCSVGHKRENSFNNAHRNFELMIEAETSNDKKIKNRCDFEPNYIDRKGLTLVSDDKIRIQYYRTERQVPGEDSFNSYYLYEMSGTIPNDSTILITSLKTYRNNSVKPVNYTFKFKRTKSKPVLENYFKKRNI